MKGRFIIAALIMVALFSMSVDAQTVDYQGLRFNALPDLPGKNYFGYNVIRVQVINSSGHERRIRMFMRVDYSSNIEEVSKKFTIAAGEVREESLYFPVANFSSQGLMIEVDGSVIRDNSLKQYFRSYRNFYIKKQALVDSKIARTDFDKVFVTSTATAVSKFDFEMNQFDGSPAQLYRTWLGYTQFQMLLYLSGSFTEMPEAIRKAMLDYVRAGGSLLIIGNVQLPDDFTDTTDSAHKEANMRVFTAGFGQVVMLPENVLDGANPDVETQLRGLVADPMGISPLPYRSPTVFSDFEMETVAAPWLILIIFTFAFLIGPVNVFALHRIGKKIWVFFTVPFASAACCIIILGYYQIFESSILKVKERSLTFLDERFNRAITLASYGVFSSGSRSDGLKFEADTEVFPVLRDDYRSSDTGKYMVLDELQHFSDGWIKPRIPCYMHLRMIQSRRERISLIGSGENMQILNGLGTDIDEILLRTHDGEFYTGRSITAGAKAPMTRAVAIRPSRSASLPDLFRRGWFSNDLVISPEKYLQPGSYLVKAKKSPFLTQPLEKDAEKNSTANIFGIMKVETQP